jgi:hypothetical protein
MYRLSPPTFTILLLFISLLVALILYTSRTFFKTHDTHSLAPVWLYPAKILALLSIGILISALRLAAGRDGGWLDKVFPARNTHLPGDIFQETHTRQVCN